VNKVRIKSLIATGLMTESGFAEIESAKANGSWSVLDSASRLEAPEELTQQFRKHPNARAQFEAFPSSAKRAIFEWISLAKTETTRLKRIQETVLKAEQGLRANDSRKRPR
jgi:uncharacterized protein YdeI (YjbR/CyaY-like superfamily)